MDTVIYENKDELVNYVVKAKKSGMNDHKIVAELLASQWDPMYIENAMLHAKVKEFEDGLVFHAITGITLMSVIFLLAILV